VVTLPSSGGHFTKYGEGSKFSTCMPKGLRCPFKARLIIVYDTATKLGELGSAESFVRPLLIVLK
jgi:hypothetical protein